MEGWGWQSVHHPDTLSAVMEKWKESIGSGEPFDMVFPLRGADGVYRPFLTRVAPSKDDSGRITGWFGLNTDISAQRAVEDALRESEERFRKFSEATREGIVIHDGKTVLDCNRSYARIFGYPAVEDVIGCPTSAFVTPEAFALVRERNRRRDEQPYMIHARRQDGSTFPAEFLGREIEWHGQRARVGIARDLTERIRYEEELNALIAEQDRLAEYNDLVAREMSHRIMNSFQMVESMLSMQTRRISDPAAREVVAQAGERLHAMALVHRLLFQVTRQDVSALNVGPFLQGLADELEPAFSSGGRCRIDVDVQDGISLKTGEGTALGLLVTELIINACKHAFGEGDDGLIAVRLHLIGGGRHRLVEDDGKGLPRGMDANSSTGLGMKLLHSFVRQLDGALEIEGPPGTRFIVSFPR